MKSLIVFILILMSGMVYAQIPKTLSYQGVLSDATGEPVTTTGVKLTFRIHTNPNNSAVLWQEVHVNVPVENGVFNVILGSQMPLDLPFDSPYFLGITVGDGAELLPLIELTSTAYSLNARSVADSAVTGGKIADGQVVRVLQLSPINGFTASLKDTVRLKAGANITFDAEGGPGAGIIISATSSNSGVDGHSLDAADGDPTDAVIVDSDGNVGIGVISPTTTLAVDGTVAATSFVGSGFGLTNINVNDADASTTNEIQSMSLSGKTLSLSLGGGSVSLASFGSPWNSSGSNLYFNTGKVGIGDNSPVATFTVGNGDKTQIHGADGDIVLKGDQGTLRFANSNGSNAPMIHMFQSGTNNSTRMLVAHSPSFPTWGIQYNDTLDVFNFIGDNLPVMHVQLSGQQRVGIGTFNPTEKLHVVGNALADAHTTPSSRRWKTNIKTLDHALDKIKYLRGVSYDRKEDGKHNIGLIAEEVGDVIPEVVEYEDNGKDTKSVAYARSVAVLIEAVKELSAKVYKLEMANEQKITYEK